MMCFYMLQTNGASLLGVRTRWRWNEEEVEGEEKQEVKKKNEVKNKNNE